MATPVYMCIDCYKAGKKVPNVLYTYPFDDPKIVESIKDKHNECGGKNIKKINLNNREVIDLLKVSKDINFILAMDKLKSEDIIEFNLKMSQFKQSTPQQLSPTSNTPKCPTCGSTKIKKISATKRWVGVGMFGLASSDMGKTMQCDDCGYKW